MANFGPNPASSNRSLLYIALIVVFLIGTIGFGALSIVAFSQAHTAKATQDKAKADAAAAARAEQKQADAQAAQTAAESPFSSYTAPDEYGAFVVKYPKTWSASVTESRSGSPQVNLLLEPGIVHTADSTLDLLPARITLVQRTLAEFIKQYTSQKSLARSDITVSGIKSTNFTGKFADKRTIRIVAVPVRDKTLVFTSESAAYASEFDQILAQSTINP